MNESIIISENVKAYFSSRVLAAMGRKVKQIKLFEPVSQQVQIAQKTVKYSPSEKLMDAFITLLAGAQGLVEVNKRLKADAGLQRAFGRRGCAEQSVFQDTLDACKAENVVQMHQAMETIFRRYSQTYRHDYRLDWQMLEVDMTGRPCGKKAKFASKGYFAKQRNKKRFEAQQVLIQLEALAHNVLVWARQWLAPCCPKIARLGIKRLVRDVFQMDGFLMFDQAVGFLYIVLNRADPLAKELRAGLHSLLAHEHVAVTLGET